LSIRLLVPAGSHLLRLPGFGERLLPFDAKLLGYPWRHPDRRVDQLQRDVHLLVSRADEQRLTRKAVFAAIWRLAHEAAGRTAPEIAANHSDPIPRLSEPWYCCAEPTEQQLQSL
ncbi:MAG: CUAEP/CCAEP-tail radical SAM (seleno)protein, partial [Burkholderiales bacterium]